MAASSTTVTSHDYELSDVKSKRKPIRPCRHCGSEWHYNYDCGSYKKDPRRAKPASSSKRDSAYRKAYLAMTSGSEEVYQEAMLAAHEAFSSDEDNDTEPTAMFVVPEDISLKGDSLYLGPTSSAKAAEILPSKHELNVLYEPEPATRKPPGLASLGSDAFKLNCRIGLPGATEIEVIADSGAAATLISKRCLDDLGSAAPVLKQGLKLRLLHLTGEAKCLGFVTMDLYFRSQLGTVLLRGVEAYVVDGMNANLLIGEDTHRAWQLHTMRPEHEAYWQVGDSPHCIAATLANRPTETFTANWEPKGAQKESAPLRGPPPQKPR